MTKHFLYIFLILFCLSACGLSEKEMEDKQKDLKLLELNLEFIEDCVSEISQNIIGYYHLPGNRKIIQPFKENLILLDSLIKINKKTINYQKNYKSYDKSFYIELCESFYKEINQLNEKDTASYFYYGDIKVENFQLDYSYQTLKEDLNRIHNNHINFLKDINVLNSSLEFKELQLYTFIYMNLIVLKSCRYLNQKIGNNSLTMTFNNEIYNGEELKLYRPNQKFQFTVFPLFLYKGKYQKSKFNIDNQHEITIEKFNKNGVNDTIWIPTDSLGHHLIKIKNLVRKDTYKENEFHYYVIER